MDIVSKEWPTRPQKGDGKTGDGNWAIYLKLYKHTAGVRSENEGM